MNFVDDVVMMLDCIVKVFVKINSFLYENIFLVRVGEIFDFWDM